MGLIKYCTVAGSCSRMREGGRDEYVEADRKRKWIKGKVMEGITKDGIESVIWAG
jgi:hypothetical protein